MRVVRYRVRAVKEGKVVFRKTFKVESRALEATRRWRKRGAEVVLRRRQVDEFKIRTHWGNTTQRPPAPKPVRVLVVHHSVTKQLSPNATIAQEKAEMRSIQAIGYARDLGGFPYGYGIPPSGRIYEGSGWGVVEAATGGFNTPTDSVVLIGNNDAFEPTQAQLDSLVDLGMWGQDEGFLARLVEVDPHQKYKATACPGRFVTPKLPAVERRING